MRLEDFERAPLLAATHISRIVAIGDRIYKRKVAQAFGFVDQRSLEARRRLCELEVSLNRRVAPDVYLGVEPLVDEHGEVCDHAVVMQRMPPERSLASMLERGVPAADCVRAVARVMADFHARADRSPAITAAGTRDAVAALWRASIDDLATFGGDPIDSSGLASIDRLASRYLAGRGPLFAGRCDRGMIVDGHGDLLCADIYCTDGGPQILDCLEFDERFRHGDVLLDVAFLVMDLLARGRPDAADTFMAAYQELSDEHHPSSLLSHNVAYRALVRAKVALYRAQAGDAGAPSEAAALLALTDDRLGRARVRLVLIGGLPGTGKSALAEELCARRGWITINTDTVRRELTGGPSPAAFGEGAYDASTTDRVYGTVLARTATALGLGETVVVDASFHDADRRAAFRAIGSEHHADVVELLCTTPHDVAAARLLRRERSHPSDATPGVAARMAESFAAWPGAREIDTARELDVAVAKAFALIDAR